MTSEELEEYANLMEERAKEATEFFKSESENEEDIVYKDNEGVMDNPLPENGESVPIFSKQPLEEQSEITQIERAEKSNEEPTENGVQLTEEDLRDILAEEEMLRLEDQQERPTSSKVLVTEVIELPKLDMNTIKTSPVKKHTPRSSFNIKQLLAEKNLSNSPSLSGAPNKLIDLDTGNLIDKKPTGMENLLERLMSTIKAKKVKKSETCNILSIENGKLEMSKVNVTRSETKDSQKDSKPGAAYFELKKNLKDIIRKKRLDELNKKQDDELEFNKCLADEDSEEEETEEILEEEYEPEDKTENNVLIDEEETAAMADNDDEEISAEEENAENETDAEEQYQINGEDEQNNKNTLALEKSQRKSRIITAFDDSEEEGGNDDIDFLKTQPEITQPSLFETQIQAQNSLADEENELLALCSGTFNETPKMTGDALMSQIPITQNCGKPLNDDELMELCSGTFDQPVFTQQEVEMGKISENLKIKAYKILSTDEENDEDEISTDKENVKRLKKFTKTQKKKTKLGFSDDEDDDDEEEGEESHCDDEEDDDNFETAGNEPETFVDYDSEENEILVQMTKNDKVQQAQNFFEKEAELSESEWGSADEDENNLDKYDLELGDEDEFDKEKLQTELGQIHARKMLDEDIREVRKIQELLFEDEEKDGVGRQRTFKWKNAESGFSLEDGRPLDEFGDNQNGDSGDEINEHQWRKVRFEREQFLKEKGLKPDSQDMSTILTNTSLPLNNSMSVAVSSKKIQIITAKKTTVSSTTDTKKGSPFLISKGIASMHKKSVRGSFLVRDKETLNKLAGFTKGSASAIAVSDMDDTAGSVSIKNVRHTNFVFATLTEEEHENLKRKADDLLNSSNENGKDFMKKPKIEPRRDKCFIDQLL